MSTNLSARPFDLEWYIAVVKCSMDRDLQNSSNSLLVNWVPLSLTIVLGTPKQLKRSLSASIVLVDVGCLHLNTSSHFVKLLRNNVHSKDLHSQCVTESTAYPSSATVVFVQVVPLLLADTLDTLLRFF